VCDPQAYEENAMDWYLTVWRKYADFNGRAQRKEYWMFTLVNSAIILTLYAAFTVCSLNEYPALGVVFGGALCLYVLATIIPGLAVSVRRLHDAGFSGWLVLLALLPLLSIAVLVMTLLDSNPGPNQYGPNPKAVPEFSMS
jgi:uncharacterized membrane protein YhaH (DUF805 family)